MMDFIKKYLSLMIPVGVTLVAVVLLMVGLMKAQSLQEQMQESISIGRRIASYKDQNISASQWELEREYQQAHARDANEISAMAKENSQRELLSYKIFPEPKETSAQIFYNFGQEYRSAIESLIKDIGALDVPTEAELNNLLQQSQTDSDRNRAAGPGGRGFGLDTKPGMSNPIIELFYKQRAETIPVYGNPARLSGYEFWNQFTYVGRQDAIEKSWYSQVGYWIQKDIIDSIKAMNKGSNSVLTSPVKQLVGVSFTGPADSEKLSVQDMPKYVTTPTDGLAPPWTGRICNDDIDVVHFNVSVVIRSDAVLKFMQELCKAKEHVFSGFFNEKQPEILKHNQITILGSQINPVDRVGEFRKGYYYGNDAIARLNLVCEYVFNRAGYDEIKPTSVKQHLGQLEEKKSEEDSGSTRRSRRGRRGSRG